MAQISQEQLESFLQNYGWSFKKVKERVWLTGWQGQSTSFPLKISLCDTWLSFEIEQLTGIEIDLESWPEISLFLLQLNHHCRMVKVSIGEAGGVCLVLEIFTSRIDYGDFSDALGVLGYFG